MPATSGRRCAGWPARSRPAYPSRSVHGRHVRGDHLPSDVREPHPRLTLTADQRLAAHLELEVHGGEIASERQDLEANALLLDSRPGRPRHPMSVDLFEAVAVLVHRIPD